MPRKADRNKLSATFVRSKKQSGKYHDGGGLYLQVTPRLTRSWLFRYNRSHDVWMGLGPFPDVPLAKARIDAGYCRALLREGVDPIAERKRKRTALRLADARNVTFADCCSGYIAAYEASWRNTKHRDQWETTLATYAEPILGKLSVQDIDTGLVLKVLQPIWYTKTETATRVRQRMESVLNWAAASGYRSGENPARWNGNLKDLLPVPTKLKKVRNHPALPFPEINDFVTALRAVDGIASRALEFVILTAARTNEAIGARWNEFDLESGLWTIPGQRMKAGKTHTVPLSPRALTLLQELHDLGSEWVFPGQVADKPLSNMAMLLTLKRMNCADLTVHGFRSTFRDWCSESTSYSHEVCEMALAHQIKNQAEAAYRRGDLLDKRRRLMADWARYIDTPRTTAIVTSIRR